MTPLQGQTALVTGATRGIGAAIAQQLMAMSAQSGQPGGGPSVEQQMVQLQAQELQIAQQRLQSQDARENAKLALKAQELQLKRQQLEVNAADKQRQAQIQASAKLLDNQTKLAQIAQKELAERVNNQP